MHELSVTQSVLDLALKHAERAGAKRIMRINLVIGELSGIVDESVQFYFDFVSKGTLAEGAQLAFERQPACLRCRACGHEFALEDGNWACPSCQAMGGEIVAGREFYMDSIELEFGQSKRNQVFRSKVLPRASKMPAIVHILGAKGSKTWFLTASPGLSKVQIEVE